MITIFDLMIYIIIAEMITHIIRNWLQMNKPTSEHDPTGEYDRDHESPLSDPGLRGVGKSMKRSP